MMEKEYIQYSVNQPMIWSTKEDFVHGRGTIKEHCNFKKLRIKMK